MKKTVVTFGLIGGGLLVFLMYIGSMIWMGSKNFELGEILGYASMIVALSTIFFGIKSYRDNQLGGLISFKQGFRIGILITLIASALYVIGWLIYYNFVDQSMMESYFEYAVEKVRTSGDSEQAIQKKIDQMESMKEMYKNPLVQIGVTFLEVFPVGLLITLLSAFILKKR